MKEECRIKPRSENVFKNKAQLAVTKFEIENPQPPSFNDCIHEETILCIQTHINNTLHVVEQCRICGVITKRLRKNEIQNWESLPSFDTKVGQVEKKTLSQWHDARNEIYLENITEGDEVIEFDYEKFSKEYDLKSPKPFSSSDCDHHNTNITIRRYSDANNAIVVQCIDCGKHISNMKKSLVKDTSKLPPFDEQKENKLYEIYSKWGVDKYEEGKKQRTIHNEKIHKRIYDGKIQYINNNTFNTYYYSEQWIWAREKILERDCHLCQACNKTAECVHHITYERLGEESHLDLISLCNNCHNLVHMKQNQYSYSYRLTPKEILNLHSISNLQT